MIGVLGGIAFLPPLQDVRMPILGDGIALAIDETAGSRSPAADLGGAADARPEHSPSCTRSSRPEVTSLLTASLACSIVVSGKGEPVMSKPAHIGLIVEDGNARIVDGVEAKVRSLGEKSFRKLPTRSGSAARGKDETALEPGVYEIHVEAPKRPELRAESRVVKVGPGSNTVIFTMGDGKQRHYYADRMKVHFTPEEGTILVLALGNGAAETLARVLAQNEMRSERIPQRAGDAAASGKEPGDVGYHRVKVPAEARSQLARVVEKIGSELRQHGLRAKFAVPIRRGEAPLQGLTNDLIVQFRGDVTRNDAEQIAEARGLSIERSVTYAGNAYILTRAGAPDYSILDVAEELMRDERVQFAEPDLIVQLDVDYTPSDTLWPQQTWMPLINQDDAFDVLGGIAPTLRGGDPNITIAVFDPQGVAPNHPDLTGTLTDGTGKLVQSFNFVAMAPQTVAALGGDHGTQCAGSATGSFDDNRGVSGVAPNCHLIGVRVPPSAQVSLLADAYIWAAGFATGNTDPAFPATPSRRADVISNSWGVNDLALSATMRAALDFITTYGRDGRGCVVTFSTGNLGYTQFSAVRTWAAYDRTIAVGASINVEPTNPVNSSQADPNGNTMNIPTAVDTRALFSPYGPELDIVAPSHTCYALGTGALVDPILSAVRVGTGNVDGCPGAMVCSDYRSSFGGTSHASPTVAGAAALILSVRPTLSWVQVRDILRESAVQIDAANANPIGQWAGGFSQWYGFGRLDVAAAVTAARDLALAPDVVARDNLTDSGAVPSAGWHAVSPDIWTRRSDDPIPALAYGTAPPHQSPRRGQNNYVFCRVKNVGSATATDVFVRAMITHFPGVEFDYPTNFTPSNGPGTAPPNPLTPGTYLIGETKVADLVPNEDRIVKMTWPAALVPPATVNVGGVDVAWHPCLLIEASPHDGPAVPGGPAFDIKKYNNIAQRNIAILDPGEMASDAYVAVAVGTSFDKGVQSLLIDRSRLPEGARLLVHVADAGLMRPLVLHVQRQGSGQREPEHPDPRGHAYGFEKRQTKRPKPWMKSGPELRLDKHQGLEAIELPPSKEPFELPLKMAGGTYALLLVAVKDVPRGARGEVHIAQRRSEGILSGGYTIQV